MLAIRLHRGGLSQLMILSRDGLSGYSGRLIALGIQESGAAFGAGIICLVTSLGASSILGRNRLDRADMRASHDVDHTSGNDLGAITAGSGNFSLTNLNASDLTGVINSGDLCVLALPSDSSVIRVSGGDSRSQLARAIHGQRDLGRIQLNLFNVFGGSIDFDNIADRQASNIGFRNIRGIVASGHGQLSQLHIIVTRSRTIFNRKHQSRNGALERGSIKALIRKAHSHITIVICFANRRCFKIQRSKRSGCHTLQLQRSLIKLDLRLADHYIFVLRNDQFYRNGCVFLSALQFDSIRCICHSGTEHQHHNKRKNPR